MVKKYSESSVNYGAKDRETSDLSVVDLQEQNPEVELGNLRFNPVDRTDFRLSIEGISNSGKTNTLAVMLEDLAGDNVPMLLVERLGMLNSIKGYDENIIVVGAQDKEAVDLVVKPEDIEVVPKLVLEEGQKILFDAMSYSNINPDESNTDHRVVGDLLKHLDRLSLRKLNSGDRKKSMVVIDEAHYYAPENNSRIVDTSDDNVKHCTNMMNRISTEGGNKGISVVLSFQRRSLISKTVTTQVDNRIVHRLDDDDATDASKFLTPEDSDPVNVSELQTGEIYAKGSFTDGLVGPTKVRKRDSPDPREGQFELPEPSDIGDVARKYGIDVDRSSQDRNETPNTIPLGESTQDASESTQDASEASEGSQRLPVGDGGETSSNREHTPDRDSRASETPSGEDTKKLQNKVEELKQKLSEKENEVEDLQQKVEDKKEKIIDLRGENAKLKRSKQQNETSTTLPSVDDASEFIESDLVQKRISLISVASGTPSETFETILQILLRHGGKKMSTVEIANKSKYGYTKVERIVTLLNHAEILRYETNRGDKYWYLGN